MTTRAMAHLPGSVPRTAGAWILGCLLLLSFGTVRAQEGERADEVAQEGEHALTGEENIALERKELPVLTVAVKDCVFLALANNPSIRAEALGVDISGTGIPEALGDFDPLLSFSAERRKLENDTENQLQSAGRGIDRFDLGISKKFLTGGTFSIAYLQARTREFDTAFANRFGASPSLYDSDLAFNLTQPLLRGAWVPFNTSSIEIARNNEEISQHQFRSMVEGIVFQVYQAYWQLVFRIANEEVQRNALELARRQLRDTLARIDVGTLARIEVHNSRASVAARVTDVQVAAKQTLDGKDLLARLILPLPDLEAWNVDLRPIDRVPVLDGGESDGDRSDDETFDERKARILERFNIEEPGTNDWTVFARDALDQRPDLIQARIDLENRELTVDRNKSLRLPRVDLSGSWTLNALDRNYSQNLEDIRLSRFQNNRSWSLGVVVEYPLGNQTLDSRYRRSKLEERQARLRYDDLARAAIADVREAERSVETAWQTIFSTNEAGYRSRKQLEAGNAKFENGLNTSYDVLLLQNDLSTALANEALAFTEYRVALARREFTIGRLVRYRDVGIDINIRE